MSTFSPEKSEAGNKFANDLRSQGITNANYVRREFSPVVRSGANGFMPYQMEGINVFLKNLYGQTSADFGSRGFNTPYAQDAVAGSSLTQALPNLFAIQNQNQLLPGQIVAQNVGNVNDALMPLINGGQFTRHKGAGLGFNAVNSFATSLGSTLGQRIGNAGNSGPMFGGTSR